MNPIRAIQALAGENYEVLQEEGKMLSIGQILKSRTVWSIALIASINGIASVKPAMDAIDPHVFPVVNGLLLFAAFLFRIAPKQGV